MTHTPGPWHADGNSVFRVEHGVLSSKVATCERYNTPNQAMHDARLIAAAPDMLAALRRIANHETRADRRSRGMVDADEVETLQRIARTILRAVEEE